MTKKEIVFKIMVVLYGYVDETNIEKFNELMNCKRSELTHNYNYFLNPQPQITGE